MLLARQAYTVSDLSELGNTNSNLMSSQPEARQANTRRCPSCHSFLRKPEEPFVRLIGSSRDRCRSLETCSWLQTVTGLAHNDATALLFDPEVELCNIADFAGSNPPWRWRCMVKPNVNMLVIRAWYSQVRIRCKVATPQLTTPPNHWPGVSDQRQTCVSRNALSYPTGGGPFWN